MRYGWISIVGVALLLTGFMATAADRPDSTSPARGDKNADSRKLLEEVLMARLTRELALDDEQTILMIRHMAECRDRMMVLRRERAEKIRELRQAVRESKDEKRIGTLMDEVLALNEKSAEARNDVFSFDAFELTTWQRARLLVFMNDFENDMRRLLHRAQDRRAKTNKSQADTPGDRKRSGARGGDSKEDTQDSGPSESPKPSTDPPSS